MLIYGSLRKSPFLAIVASLQGPELLFKEESIFIFKWALFEYGSEVLVLESDFYFFIFVIYRNLPLSLIKQTNKQKNSRFFEKNWETI